MTLPKPEPEFWQHQLRKAEEKRVRDFGTFLDSLWAKPSEGGRSLTATGE